MATLEEEYKKYQGENYDAVNSMYDAQKQSQLSQLESAYNQNLSKAEAAKEAIAPQYQQRANDLAVQFERNRRNLNQQAAGNGLNTGAGSQMQLALGSNYQRDYGGIRTAEQQAVDQADRGIRDLQAAYQTSVQQAVADNDYQRAQALLAEYKNQYARQLQQAQTLASYGDFSGYNGIPGYTPEQISSMQNAWQASNPDLAYHTGRITAEQYRAMTGQWPTGYTAPGGGGWGGYTQPKTETGETEEERLARLMGNGDPTDPVAGAAAANAAQARGKAMTDYYNRLINGTQPAAGANSTAADRPSSAIDWLNLNYSPRNPPVFTTPRLQEMDSTIAGLEKAGASKEEIAGIVSNMYGLK